jgi:glycosyltransferase involved in cell wall biosynthesis
MIVAGLTVVKNEERLIEANLRHHLQTQGFDLFLVIDNGSADRTVEIVQGMGDPRILLARTPPKQGFVQSGAFTTGAQALLEEHGADWVLPTDGDEFWISRRYGTVRAALEALEGEPEAAVTHGWCFHPTALDDPGEADPLRRLRWARPEPHRRVLLARRLAGRLAALPVGAHWADLKGGGHPEGVSLDRDHLARHHYRYLSRDDYRRRIMAQAEGNILRLGTQWLTGRSGYAERILTWYRLIREGRFDGEYDRRFVLSADQVREEQAEGKLERREELARLRGSAASTTA